MGGGAVLRQAARGRHRPDAAVSVSAVSRWYVRDTRPMQRVHWLLETTAGRRLGSRVVRLRLGEPWLTVPPSPLEVVSAVAPTPLLLVHGDRDEYFPLEHFRALAQAAGPTATAWVVPGFGHAESGATAPLVERIGRWASATIDP
jgi:pimeloyl-ACP methyl ester carboxylesterase